MKATLFSFILAQHEPYFCVVLDRYWNVLAANRAYSHDALYKYNTGYIVHGGSSRTR